MAFDITKLNKSSFRGIPFSTKDDERSGGQRLTDHSFINGGTKTESNGVNNDIFKISAYIGGDDYLTQKEALREAFEDITSGVLVDKFHGTHEVYVSTWSIKETITQFGKATIDITFKKAENQVIVDSDIVYTVSVREEAIANFEEDFDNEVGEELTDSIADDLVEFWESILDIIKFLEDVKDTLQDIKSQIGRTISQVKTAILSIESLTDDISNIWNSFDAVLDTDLFGSTEQKSFSNNLREILEQSSTKIFINAAQETANLQSKLYINTAIAGLTETSIKNLENVEFETGDDLGSVKDDILTIMEILEANIVIEDDASIEKIVTKQNLLDKYQLSKREFIEFYTQKYSGLQVLKDNDIVATTDILNLTMDKYSDINRVDEVLINNDIVDPFFINGTIKLLDR